MAQSHGHLSTGDKPGQHWMAASDTLSLCKTFLSLAGNED